MALMRCDFFSDVLGMSTSMTVILPEGTTGDFPVLYLLHGLSDDDTAWTRRTSIERYAADRGIAVVMPQGQQSFYADEVHGLPFWTFLTKELPAKVQSLFRISSRREDTFVAGLSMGGYGAMKWVLREPWRFGAAASLSGALALSHPSDRSDPGFAALMQRVFGDGPTDGTPDDVLHLMRSADPTSLPPLFVGCGTEDFLYKSNLALIGEAETRGVQLTVALGPGGHEWPYWDARIREVLDWLPLRR